MKYAPWIMMIWMKNPGESLTSNLPSRSEKTFSFIIWWKLHGITLVVSTSWEIIFSSITNINYNEILNIFKWRKLALEVHYMFRLHQYYPLKHNNCLQNDCKLIWTSHFFSNFLLYFIPLNFQKNFKMWQHGGCNWIGQVYVKIGVFVLTKQNIKDKLWFLDRK